LNRPGVKPAQPVEPSAVEPGRADSCAQGVPVWLPEQTTSGLYPALYADAAVLKRLGLEGEPDAERKRKIELGIERLLGMQRYNGSFGLWGADGRGRILADGLRHRLPAARPRPGFCRTA
jgi:hypothetical protein